MAKAKYKQNSRGEYATRLWDGTYNKDGSKHRINLKSKKSSADLENKVRALRNKIDNGLYVQAVDILFTDYAEKWLSVKKSVRGKNTRAMYRNIIDTHLSFLESVKLTDIRNSHFQMAINNALDNREPANRYILLFAKSFKWLLLIITSVKEWKKILQREFLCQVTRKLKNGP